MKSSLLLLSFLILFPAVSFAGTFTYTVKKSGETCTEIAEKVYGDSARVDLLHKFNDLTDLCWLGNRKARRLKGGTELKLPDPPSAGRISNKDGKVNSKSPDTDWSPADLGLELYRLWRVNTLDESRAEVTFRDRSRLEMRENTLILIYGASKSKARSTPSRASLERGALRSKLDELAGSGVVVETPSAIAAVKSRSALVSVNETGTTRVANHGEGAVGVSANKKSKKKRKKKKKKKMVLVKTGMGTKVEKGKEPEPARPLPTTPSWKKSPALFVTIGATPTTIFAEWDAVDVAENYYVEVSEDEAATQIIQSVVVPKTITRLQIENLPPGDYFASVAAIDLDQFESIPTGPRRIRVREIKVQGTLISPDPLRVALGTAFISPKDILCSREETEATRRTVLTDVGDQKVNCVDQKGQQVGDFAVEAVAPTVDLTSEAIVDETLTLTTRQVIDVTFDPQIPLTVDASSDVLEIDPPIRIDERTLRYAVHPKSPEPTTGAFGLNVGETELASVAVSSGESISATRWRVGAGASFTNVQQDPRFEEETGSWTMLELIGGVAPNDRVSVELGLGLGALDTDGGFIGALDYRATGRFNLLTDEFRPFLSATFGAQTNFDQEKTIGIARAGLGATYRIGDELGVRLDLDAGFAEGRPDGISILPRAVAGFFWEFR